MSRRDQMPEPDMSAVDQDSVLRSRVSLSTPAHTPGTQRPYTGTRRTGTRPDPEGKRRISLYVTAEAADALDAAVDRVLATLGSTEVPRHVALSALLHRAAEHADQIAAELGQQRAAELAEQLQHLQGREQ